MLFRSLCNQQGQPPVQGPPGLNHAVSISAVIFDVGNVLYDWDPRFLYERLIDDEQALDTFLRDVVTPEWHFQHDAGRPFAETSAELAARYPQHADLIGLWGPRFNDSIRGRIEGMAELVAELDEAGVPLFAITNFSHEFWPAFLKAEGEMFAHFRDVLRSEEHTSELQSLMRISYAVFCLKKKK